MMTTADVLDGRELAAHLGRVLDQRAIAYVHVHYAKPGCFACRARLASQPSFGWSTAMPAPCGSIQHENRPTFGMSVGGTVSCAPSRPARSDV